MFLMLSFLNCEVAYGAVRKGSLRATPSRTWAKLISASPFLKSQTRLYSSPPPAACNTHPTLEMAPKTPARIWPWEKEEMVLIKPADPVAVRYQPLIARAATAPYMGCQ